MYSRIKPFLVNIGALGVIAFALVLLSNTGAFTPPLYNAATSTVQTATAVVSRSSTSTSSPEIQASSTPFTPKPKKTSAATAKPALKTGTSSSSPPITTQKNNPEVTRIENPYPFAQKSFGDVNLEARAALVNILCMPRTGGLRPISGSGIIIDPRGVILTNAHVAQYVLLSQSPQIDLACTIRALSPARPLWKAEVLYIPPIWVREHAADITSERPTGTGEHDYALLRITGTVDGSPLPAAFASLPVDTREGIGFIDDIVLAASYPAEFLGGIAAQFDLYPVSSITAIKELLTFDIRTIDLLSLGGIIGAQSGSSGGAVVNAWGRLIGVITTTSEGATTADRDLRAVTLSYINRDLATQTQFDLATILGGDVIAQAADFKAHEAPALLLLLIEQISEQYR